MWLLVLFYFLKLYIQEQSLGPGGNWGRYTGILGPWGSGHPHVVTGVRGYVHVSYVSPVPGSSVLPRSRGVGPQDEGLYSG